MSSSREATRHSAQCPPASHRQLRIEPPGVHTSSETQQPAGKEHAGKPRPEQRFYIGDKEWLKCIDRAEPEFEHQLHLLCVCIAQAQCLKLSISSRVKQGYPNFGVAGGVRWCVSSAQHSAWHTEMGFSLILRLFHLVSEVQLLWCPHSRAGSQDSARPRASSGSPGLSVLNHVPKRGARQVGG